MESSFSACAALTHLAVDALSLPSRCSATIRTLPITATLLLQRGDQFGRVASPSTPRLHGRRRVVRWFSKCRRHRRRGRRTMVSSGMALHDVGSLMKRGSLRRRSVVTTAGRSTSRVSRPASTSRTTVALPPSMSSFDANVACGRPTAWQHLSGLAGVVVDRLLAGMTRSGCSLLDQLQQGAGGGQRLDRRRQPRGWRDWRPSRQAVAQVGLGIGGAMVATTTSLAMPLSPQAQGFFQRDVVRRVGRQPKTPSVTARTVRLDLNADVCSPPRACSRRGSSSCGNLWENGAMRPAPSISRTRPDPAGRGQRRYQDCPKVR